MERYKEIIKKLLGLCATHKDIKAIIVIGSHSRKYKKADKYSDLDLIVACDAPEVILYEDDLVKKLGKIKYSFVEDTFANQKERRVLFEGSLDVDLVVVTTEFLRKALANGVIDDIMRRGYSVLYDEVDFSSLMKNLPLFGDVENTIPTEQEFKNLVNDFFYHTVWAEKKILRGEIWTAKMCVDAYMKNHLLRMIEIYEVCMNGTGFDIWHNGRMLEQWADAEVLHELGQCFAHYDADDIMKALKHTTALFTSLSKVCAQKYGYVSGVGVIDCK